MDIRKNNILEIVKPVDLGLARSLPVGLILFCEKGGRTPKMLCLLEGQLVRFSISANRLSGRVCSAPRHAVPQRLAVLSGIGVGQAPVGALDVGEVVSLASNVHYPGGRFKKGVLAKVLVLADDHVEVAVAGGRGQSPMVSITLPLKSLESASRGISEPYSVERKRLEVSSIRIEKGKGACSDAGTYSVAIDVHGQQLIAYGRPGMGWRFSGPRAALKSLQANVAYYHRTELGGMPDASLTLQHYLDYVVSAEGVMNYDSFITGALSEGMTDRSSAKAREA